MGFTGTVTTGSQDIPISTVKLVGRIRREEPVGDLLQVLYQVPKPEEIMTLADWQRPDPRRPAVFPLTSQEAGQRVKADHLKKWCYIRPERVRLKSGHITELYFDTGVALAPFEAAELHMQQVLFVRGAKLIRPRQGKPYYRSYPDGYPQNNLCNLPPYYSALAVTLAREFTDFNHTVIYVAQNTSETIWHWQPQGGQSVGVVACHAISTYPRLQEMIMALARSRS
jgi:hypothetical protein